MEQPWWLLATDGSDSLGSFEMFLEMMRRKKELKARCEVLRETGRLAEAVVAV